MKNPLLGLALVLPAGLMACSAPRGAGDGLATSVDQRPVRWILVERRCGSGAWGEIGDGSGNLNPEATILVFEPVYDIPAHEPELCANRSPVRVELVSLTPARTARPGQVVEAVVRLADAAPDTRYTLVATPSSPGVSLLEPSTLEVTGSKLAAFRFTRNTPGSGGIEIRVRSDN